jgi:hypothetical protein
MKLKQQLATIKIWANTLINTTKQKKTTTLLAPTTTKGAKLRKPKYEEQMS